MDVGLERLLMLMVLFVILVHPLHTFLLLPCGVVPGLGGAHMIVVPVVRWVDSTIVWPVKVALAVAGCNMCTWHAWHTGTCGTTASLFGIQHSGGHQPLSSLFFVVAHVFCLTMICSILMFASSLLFLLYMQ
jgi:hypothetical protein